ncbi:hypothetical protein NWF34_10175 [Gordonia sp. GONU]|uniref:hypothetical protein n=1 Tax=Gordonia sp. GONU TaxID=2972949 RepID=UPI0021AD247C|nr:hypothetical protein [Gordonia sp. GONU]MCR8897315.1 hypothetical protein [Gordonia sp. GONU]
MSGTMGSVASVLTSGGVGAVVSGVVIAVITAVSKRGSERATAAKSIAEAEQTDAGAAEILTGIAAKMTADIRQENQSLRVELRELKGAVDDLTHAVETAIPLLEQAGHVDAVSEIRTAREHVRRVL